MKFPNRDLLVLVRNEFRSPDSMEYEVEQLNKMLVEFETMENFCKSHEVFDLNRYRVIQSEKLIMNLSRQKKQKPFVFFCNKN